MRATLLVGNVPSAQPGPEAAKALAAHRPILADHLVEDALADPSRTRPAGSWPTPRGRPWRRRLPSGRPGLLPHRGKHASGGGR
eukprot:7935949-Alexandrium_andersonii.AAC.1